jgi:uncharacterized protein
MQKTCLGVACLGLLFVCISTVLVGSSFAGTNVFINEIHYDNSGTDTGESIEIAGPANTDLTGWTLVLYNGNGGLAYNTINLSGSIPQQQNGYGTLFYPTNGLQNGAPDGIALVDGGSNVVQFLSYEGSFTAVDGPAMGLTSTDIGVEESYETLIGNSLQLAGVGEMYEDFTWTPEVPETLGAVNTNQTFTGSGNSILINELDADTLGTDVMEFVELYDGGSGNTSLDGLVVVFYNGSSDTSYNAFDLDGYLTDANGYFVLGNFDVPGTDIIFPSSGLQNGADAVAVYTGDSSDFPFGTAVTVSNLVDAVVYDTNDADDAGLLVLLNPGQPQVNEGGAGDQYNHSSQRCPNGTGEARNTSSYWQSLPTPKGENSCVGQISYIHDIQGDSTSSPVIGTGVIVEGVVVGDFQTSSHLSGFFVQEEESDFDGSNLTSEGIFIYDGSSPITDVSVGDVVRVSGTVAEYYSLTELQNVTVTVVGTGVATPATVSLPVSSLNEWEQYEGMLINIPQTLYVTDNYNQGRYGEVELSVGDRLSIPTNTVSPGALALTLQDMNDRSRIQLDDGSRSQNPYPVPYFDIDNILRAGDTLPALEGVLSYSFDAYEVHPTMSVNFTRVNERPLLPDEVGNALKVSSFNVLNYFTTIDFGADICGPLSDLSCRGADTPEEFIRQRDKILAVITTMDADVIGIIEIENHPADDALIDLVKGLNDLEGAGAYDYINTGVIGTDAIKVALIFKPGKVTPGGSYAILDSSVDPLFLDTKNRPSLAQTFEQNDKGEKFTVAVNHFKSKGSACDDVGDPDLGDGQANCNLTRTDAATALVNWLETNPTDSGDQDFLIIGDLNSYIMEDPLTVIKDKGFFDLIGTMGEGNPYSYVFQGQAGCLDHALASPSMYKKVAGVSLWHINSDEPAALDYNDYNQAYLYSPDLYRSSDHDPMVIVFKKAKFIWAMFLPAITGSGKQEYPTSVKLKSGSNH